MNTGEKAILLKITKKWLNYLIRTYNSPISYISDVRNQASIITIYNQLEIQANLLNKETVVPLSTADFNKLFQTNYPNKNYFVYMELFTDKNFESFYNRLNQIKTGKLKIENPKNQELIKILLMFINQKLPSIYIKKFNPLSIPDVYSFGQHNFIFKLNYQEANKWFFILYEPESNLKYLIILFTKDNLFKNLFQTKFQNIKTKEDNFKKYITNIKYNNKIILGNCNRIPISLLDTPQGFIPLKISDIIY